MQCYPILRASFFFDHTYEGCLVEIEMLFNSPAIKSVQNLKTEQQLASVEQRIADITQKLSKANVTSSKPKSTISDWAAAYQAWNNFEDTEELQQSKQTEEARLNSLLSRADNLGHYHDHAKEREFFELSDADKFKACEDNRFMGNFLFREEDNSEQAKLDDLRRACLCNISLCYLRLGHCRQAVESATIVLKETDGKHSKALFRRAQAYRVLDEYSPALADLKAALELSPGDVAVVAEIKLVQELRERYEHNAKDFAQQILQPNNNSNTGTGTGGLYGNRKHGGHAEEDQEEPIFNINLPLEPVLPEGVYASTCWTATTASGSNSSSSKGGTGGVGTSSI